MIKKQKKLTEEHKRKIGEANRIRLKEFYERNPNYRNNGMFKKDSIPWNKGKEFLAIREENHPMWKGGIKTFRKILKRNNIDTTHCRICKEEINRYCVHHVNGNQQDNRIENLNVLCYFCHNAIHDTPNKIANRFQIGHIPLSNGHNQFTPKELLIK